MKVLITGAAGYIGSALIKRLGENSDIDVIYALDAVEIPSSIINKDVQPITLDLTNVEDVSRSLSDIDVDVVVHLAAKIRGDIQDLINVNVIGTSNIMEAVKKDRLRMFIAASTAAQLYGNARYIPIDEGHPVNPMSPYGVSKHLMEQLLMYYVRRHDVPVTIFRQTNVYGPSPVKKFTVINRFVDQALNKGEIDIHGDGKQVRNFIYIDDLIEFYIRAILSSKETPVKGEIINIAGPGEHTIREIAEMVSKHIMEKTGRDVRIKHVPSTHVGRGEIYRFKISIEKAIKLFNYRPKITVYKGLEMLLKEVV